MKACIMTNVGSQKPSVKLVFVQLCFDRDNIQNILLLQYLWTEQNKLHTDRNQYLYFCFHAHKFQTIFIQIFFGIHNNWPYYLILSHNSDIKLAWA